MSTLAHSFAMVFDPYVLMVMVLSGLFGLFVGAVPGLTATMATALLVPITFFMDPVPAIAAIVTASAMAIFSGDIPGALLRIPGTPASAAYVDDAYRMTRDGQGAEALGTLLIFSVIGGIFGTIVLIVASPILAELALKFSSFEYFWLVLLGLSAAVFVSPGSVLRGLVSLMIGLVAACVGMDNPTAEPRYTFGNIDLLGGISFIPAMIGLFAFAEVLRYLARGHKLPPPLRPSTKGMITSQWRILKRYPIQMLRGNVTGTVIGALPGAGADIAAWISYAISKRFSREPEKFGKGHIEGLVEAGASNNAAVSGAWIPALVFGIPGDSITAIVIGVLYIKGMNPGPMIFLNQAELINALFIVFLLANIMMIGLGWLAIVTSTRILAVPQRVLMPIILMFCIIGAFAITNSIFGIILMLCFGILGFLMEESDIPIAPAILGLVLGPLLEQHFITSMIKADGNMLAFFDRPIAAGLGVLTILVWLAPLVRKALMSSRSVAVN